MPAIIFSTIFWLPVWELYYCLILTLSIPCNIIGCMLLPLVLCGCETWYLTLREEYWLRMFGNRVLRKVFGPNREEVTGGMEKLHSGEFMIFTPQQVLSRWSSQGGYSGRNMWHIWRTWFLLEKHEGKTPLTGAKHRRGDKVKMHLQELWLQGVN